MNTDNNPNNKGLGWIPDYPDLRDYQLQSDNITGLDGRLKREDRSKEIEKIAQEFTNFAESFSALLDEISNSSNFKKSTDIKTLANKLKIAVSNQTDEIQSVIFGDISFESVNIYRQLRQGVESKTPFSHPKEFSYKSDVEKRIFELKNCLYFIFQHQNFPQQELCDENVSETIKSVQNLRSFDKALKWLRDASFDDSTYRLVLLFQYCADIWVDGIVGLETYTALNEHFNYFSACEEFKVEVNKFRERFNSSFDPQCQFRPSDSYQPKSRLLPVSLLLPKEVFRRILNQLEDWAIQEVGKGDIFEEEYLSAANIRDVDTFRNLLKGDPLQDPEGWIKQQSRFFFDEEIDEFITIFQNEFHLIEPSIATVIKILTPLANFRNEPFEAIVSRGLNRFEEIMSQQAPKVALSNNTESTKVTREFVLQALQQVHVVFNAEIEFKIALKARESSSGASNIDANLYFYFLVRKFVRRFLPLNSQLNTVTTSNSDSLNPFEKREILEVVKLCQPAHLEMKFFEVTSLQVPLRRKFLEFLINGELKTTKDNCIKNFLFLPSVVDLSYWCSEIEDQGSLNSCTALAGIALLEYFMNRSNGKYTDASSLFLYKATRELMNLKGDVGASVRETMKAMALFGTPPEQYWRYDEAKVNEDPPSFCYSFAQNYQALKYFRLDYAGILKEVLIVQIKAVIATGFPCVFGFTIYTSAYEDSNYQSGLIPFPNHQRDRVVGGHSVVAVGYDDYRKIERKDRPDPSEGAFLIRNSFGTSWGNGGYGWLPYDYVLAGLTADWWSLLKAEWFNDDFWQGVRGNQGPDRTDRQG